MGKTIRKELTEKQKVAQKNRKGYQQPKRTTKFYVEQSEKENY